MVVSERRIASRFSEAFQSTKQVTITPLASPLFRTAAIPSNEGTPNKDHTEDFMIADDDVRLRGNSGGFASEQHHTDVSAAGADAC